MRQFILAGIVVWAVATLADADTIYMRNGTTYEGKATSKEGDKKVLIETPMGNFEVDAADVIHIVPGTTPVGSTSAPAAVARAIIPIEGRRPLPTDQITNPEPVIFTFMRNLTALSPGTETYDARQQIEQWRASAHDRKRKVGAEWVLPSEFTRRRQIYTKEIKEAADLLSKVPRSVTIGGGAVDANVERERKKAMVAVYDKLDSTARAWADPLIRNFLLGISTYDRPDFPQSEALFRKCIDEAPLVAAFHQGRAMCQLANDHPLWCLEEMLATLALRPDSGDMLTDIQQAMKKVPGTSIRDPIYLEAQRVLGLYPDATKKGYTSVGTVNWLMPGREWQARGETLPTPPYDRLVFRQAVGVPIGTNTLLVDSELAKDGTELFVRIDGNTIAPAYAKRWSASAKAPAVTTITVPGYEFTVPKMIQDGNQVPGEAPMYGFAVPSYSEMGSMVRRVTGKVGGAATDGSVIVSGTLAAGEATTPVFVGEGTFIGFLAAKTDVTVENGGPDRFVPLWQFSQVLRQIKTAVPDNATYGRTKRNATSRAAPGESFLVTATVTETLD